MKSRRLKVVASYQSDLGLVLNWLRLKKSISSSSETYETKRGLYAVDVMTRLSRKDLSLVVKDRFGTFAKVI
tara:strand:- start:1160 stop:1375 length:216 start_codon:yes stop_codon:yes gene_type:complete